MLAQGLATVPLLQVVAGMEKEERKDQKDDIILKVSTLCNENIKHHNES